MRRRALLRTAAAAALPAALAGCSGSGSAGGSSDESAPAPPAFVRDVAFDGPDLVVDVDPGADAAVSRVSLTRATGEPIASRSVPPSGVVRLPVLRPAEFVSRSTALHSLSFDTADGAVEYGLAPVAHVDVRSLRRARDGRPGSAAFVVANTGEVPVMLRDVLVGGEAPSPVEPVGEDERPPPGWPRIVPTDPAARPTGVVRRDLVLPVGTARRFRTTYAPFAAGDAAACDGRERIVDATAHLVSGPRIGYSFRVALGGDAEPVAGTGGEAVVCGDVDVLEPE